MRYNSVFYFSVIIIFISNRALILTIMGCLQEWRKQKCASTKHLDGQVIRYCALKNYFIILIVKPKSKSQAQKVLNPSTKDLG